jgi:predicted nucleic acid-binding protein
MLVDTSSLIRTLQPHHPFYASADLAIRLLPGQRTQLHITAQNLVELWVVATRPRGENGLEMSTGEAAAEMNKIKSMFIFLPDTPAVYPAREALVTKYQVSGKPAHDARLVAVMQFHGVTAILTFDRAGFSRFTGINVVHPNDVAA